MPQRALYRLFSALAVLIFLNTVVLAAPIEIVYPKENNAEIKARSTFFIGNTDKKATLTINGKKVKVYKNGGFVHVVPLKTGENNFTLKSTMSGSTDTTVFTIIKPKPKAPLPSYPLRIERESISPNADIAYRAGDYIKVRFRGSRGARAYFRIAGGRRNYMKYSNGYYYGSYKIRSADVFQDASVKVYLIRKKSVVSRLAKGRASVLALPMVGEITENGAAVKNQPEKSRMTPLPIGTRVIITAKDGNNYRIKLNGKSAWVSSREVEIIPKAPIPKSFIDRIFVDGNEKYTEIRLPLESRPAFEASHNNTPEMTVKLYNVKANIDEFNYEKEDAFIKEIAWSQPSDNVFKLKIIPNSHQFWGYDYFWDGNTLVLRLKKPPKDCARNIFKDKIIAIDPGHGGEELGAIGPTGITEKEINLEISNYLKNELEALGAKIVMIREDDSDVYIYDRPEIAKAGEADVLISVHNNALPDGSDPYKVHGTSTYYYHPQSLRLAKAVHGAMIEDLGLKNLGVRYKSLVLARAYEQPSILIETAFMIHPYEYQLLCKKSFQKKVAKSLKRGLENFFRNN